MTIKWSKYYAFSSEIEDWIKHGLPTRLTISKKKYLGKGSLIFIQEAIQRKVVDGKAIAVFVADGDFYKDSWDYLDYVCLPAINNPENSRFKFKITALHPEIIPYKRTDPTIVAENKVVVSVTPL